jgi:hypothetical protein
MDVCVYSYNNIETECNNIEIIDVFCNCFMSSPTIEPLDITNTTNVSMFTDDDDDDETTDENSSDDNVR